MTKEHRQLAVSLDVTTPAKDAHPSEYAVEQADPLNTVVQIEVGPLFTKLSLRGFDYYFDHVTGRLLERV